MHAIKYNLLSYRKSGQPKLRKPKELRGINRAFSVDYIPKKARCQVFIKGNDVFVKHVDYFSPTLRDARLPDASLDVLAKKLLNKEVAKKFIYTDNWGSIVLRNEAWIKVANLAYVAHNNKFYPDVVLDILKAQADYHNIDYVELMCTPMERFWEGVVTQIIDKGGDAA